MIEPIWLSISRAFVGLQEIPGSKSNPVILKWVEDLKAPSWYDDDDKAWCALFMNRILMAAQLPLSGKGFELLRAKSFEDWGFSIDVPIYGCIMVFNRPEGAHVGMYLGERKDAYYILGANQSNTVGTAWIAKQRLTSSRWIGQVIIADTGRVWVNNDGSAISTNEN